MKKFKLSILITLLFCLSFGFIQAQDKVVFMGNSITQFWSSTHPAFFTGKPYINKGISGQTTSQMLNRFDADVIQQNPSIVVFLGGTNDIAQNGGPITVEQIMNNISTMAQMAKTNGIQVILCSVLPVYQYNWRPEIKPIEQIIALNELIKKYTEENEMVYCDFYSPLVNEEKGLKSEYSNDGVHPNLAGYLVMEPIVVSAIQKAIANTLTNALPEKTIAADKFEVYPNPFKHGSLTVKIPKGGGNLCVTDSNGKKIFQEQVNQKTFTIDKSVFQQNGIYIINVFSSGKVYSTKVVFSK